MSRERPGSRGWWIETGVIALSGLVLSAWLWDGSPFGANPSSPAADTASSPEAASGERAPDAPRQTGMARLIDEGCLTSEDLRALREGRQLQVICPRPDTVILRDLPPRDRPFP